MVEEKSNYPTIPYSEMFVMASIPVILIAFGMLLPEYIEVESWVGFSIYYLGMVIMGLYFMKCQRLDDSAVGEPPEVEGEPLLLLWKNTHRYIFMLSGAVVLFIVLFRVITILTR